MSYSEFDKIDNSIEKMLDTEKRRYTSPFSYFDELDANKPDMWTGKEVGLKSNDYGSLNSSPIDYNNGASDFVWTPGEEILLQESIQNH